RHFRIEAMIGGGAFIFAQLLGGDARLRGKGIRLDAERDAAIMVTLGLAFGWDFIAHIRHPSKTRPRRRPARHSLNASARYSLRAIGSRVAFVARVVGMVAVAHAATGRYIGLPPIGGLTWLGPAPFGRIGKIGPLMTAART